MKERQIKDFKRITKETDITLSLNIDGKGESHITTGIPFFDHMLHTLSRHASFDIILKAKGDIDVDFHHTVEDVGIVLGTVFRKALGDVIGIARFADVTIPLDEALARVVVDISGRSYLHYDVSFERPDDGTAVNPWLFEEFFRAFTNESKITLHIDKIRGDNSHHIIEAVFKAFAHALNRAVKIEGEGLLSTKGTL